MSIVKFNVIECFIFFLIIMGTANLSGFTFNGICEIVFRNLLLTFFCTLRLLSLRLYYLIIACRSMYSMHIRWGSFINHLVIFMHMSILHQ